MLSPLFENTKIIRKKAKALEKRHIKALRKSNLEIEEMLQKLPANKIDNILCDEENDRETYFPVDHRIVK